MAVKTYGSIQLNKEGKWEITEAEPHVCIRLKNVFPGIPKHQAPPFLFACTPELCHDLLWFMQRYPLAVSKKDQETLQEGSKRHVSTVNEREFILSPKYKPRPITLNPGKEARNYQLVAADFHVKVDRWLLGDDMGLGKTISALVCMKKSGKFPVAVVVQAHLPKQWKAKVEEFTNLRVHIIKTTKMYSLPEADVYIFSYSKIAYWTAIFQQRFFKGCVFDEVQELRIAGSNKYCGAQALSNHVEWCLGMSGTPIYNYGGEIFCVLNVIKPWCLGTFPEFQREWTDGGEKCKVLNPQALGSYLREQSLMLRRTREDVGREMPPVNKVVYTVQYDQGVAQKAEALAYQLAIKTTQGAFMERGSAARELDALARHTTGVAKARGVAEFVRILLENDRPVLLGGWHRDVYDIWMKELAEYNPVLYTGSESPAAKAESVRRFTSREASLMIMSLRSGTGLDGLQHMCHTVVFGELDWSPKIHDQFTARVDRDEQQELVDVFYAVSEEGSDPVIMDTLGIKSSQSHGIVDPFTIPSQQLSDDTNIQRLAQHYLDKKRGHAVSLPA